MRTAVNEYNRDLSIVRYRDLRQVVQSIAIKCTQSLGETGFAILAIRVDVKQ
jgi:hypothetical protein